MDHHCIITDNCVGRDNFRYFLHFCGWASLALTAGLTVLITHIYTYNKAAGFGLKSFYQLIFVTNPMTIGVALLKKEIDLVAIFDSCLLVVVITLFVIVTLPMCNTLINIFYNTDEVDKLKNRTTA